MVHNTAISSCGLNPRGSFRGLEKRSEVAWHILTLAHTYNHLGLQQAKWNYPSRCPKWDQNPLTPCSPLKRINLPAYQSTIKRLRSESSRGQNAIDFVGHIHSLRNGIQSKDIYWILLYYLSVTDCD